MGKNPYGKLESDEERKKFIIELIASINKRIADDKAIIVNWQNELNKILEKEERERKTIVRSKSAGKLRNLAVTLRLVRDAPIRF